MDQSFYRSMIGSLLYITTNHHDITFAIGIYARWQENLKDNHLTQVKRVIKYINGSCDYGIMYSYDTNSIIVEYYDVDCVGSAEDRKSTIGGCFILGNKLISRFSKKKNCVSLSIQKLNTFLLEVVALNFCG